MTTTDSWHEDERFWVTFRDAMFPPEKFEDANEEVDALHELVDLDADASVLDLPCGVGRHSIEFAARGHDVTGVDATAPYVEEARERAQARASKSESDLDGSVEFVHEDMRSFSRDGAYDLAVNLYTSFGYFEDRADDETTARNVYEALRPDGAFVLDLAGKETLARDFQERSWQAFEHGYVLEERSVTDDWSWTDNRWLLVVDDDVHEYDVSHRLYSAYELRTLLETVGFADVTVHGNYDGDPYDESAERLLVVARK